MTSPEFPDAGWPVEEEPVEEYLYSEEEAIQVEPAYPAVHGPISALKFDIFTIPQLRAYAADNNIDLGNAKKHRDIVKRILEAQTVEPAAPMSVSNGLDLSSLYEHMPPEFAEKLTKALHARGLVEPGDYFKAGAANLFRSAMLNVIKHDFLSAQALAQKVWVDNAGRKRGE